MATTQKPAARVRPLPGDQTAPRAARRRCPRGRWSISTTTGPNNGPLPSVIPPDHNVHNRWHFHAEGSVENVRSPSWIDSIEKVPEQGFYTLRRELPFDGGSWPKGSIVQLGYTRTADPILFIARAARRA